MATLSESQDAWLYSLGRVSGWLVEVTLMYVILAFPTGRLPARVDRALVAVDRARRAGPVPPDGAAGRDLPGADRRGRTAATGAPATRSCSSTASRPSSTIVVRPLREILVVGLFAAVTARVAWRMRGASSLTRRALGPVLAVSLFRLGAFALTPRGPPHRAGLAARRRRRLAARPQPCRCSRSRSWWACGGGGSSWPRRCSAWPARLRGPSAGRTICARRSPTPSRIRRWTSRTGSRTARAAGRTPPGIRSRRRWRRRSAR